MLHTNSEILSATSNRVNGLLIIMTATETKELVKKVQLGDQQSFKLLIEQYQKLAFSIVYRMVLNETDREDLCQDIFVKVYKNLSSFTFSAKLSTWIARIAVNTCINHLKKKKVPLFGDFASENETLEESILETTNPADFTESRDLSNRLQQEIDHLKPQYRTILTLYHLEDMSYAEIGGVLNLPDGTVKSYLFRARKLLKERLIDKYEQEELWNSNA